MTVMDAEMLGVQLALSSGHSRIALDSQSPDICTYRQRAHEKVAVGNWEIARTRMSMWGGTKCSTPTEMPVDRGWKRENGRRVHE